MRAGHILALSLLTALSCRSKVEPRKGPSASSEPLSSTPVVSARPAEPPPADGKPLSGKLSRCGWGVVGQTAGGDAPPWMIGLVDVVAAREVSGLKVLLTELNVGDAAVARGSGDPSLLLQESGGAYSFGAAGTRPLDGPLATGPSRLRVATRVEGSMKELLAKRPERCRIVLTDENGNNLAVEGPLDPPWEMQ